MYNERENGMICCYYPEVWYNNTNDDNDRHNKKECCFCEKCEKESHGNWDSDNKTTCNSNCDDLFNNNRGNKRCSYHSNNNENYDCEEKNINSSYNNRRRCCVCRLFRICR